MKLSTFTKATVLTLALSGLGPAMAQDQLRTQDQDMLQLRDQIPGYDYMTQRERETFMERMRLAKTDQERERIRQEHREQMDMRTRSINYTREGGASVGPGAGPASGMNGRPPILLPKKGGARR